VPVDRATTIPDFLAGKSQARSLGRKHPMSLKINELCVNCDVCEPACPNQAISQGEAIYVIDPARCTECVGHFDEPQCVVVCPVECIDPDPDHPESHDNLLAKLRRLQGEGVA
jgi:ferredoxin